MDDAESLRWETDSREIAYTCPGFEIHHEAVTLPDGTETDFDFLHDEPSVVVLPFTPDGEFVLVEEWRQAVKGLTCSFPAGGVEPGEALQAAASRELTEETGYEAAQIEALDSFEPATGISDAVFHYFVATGCRPTGSQDLDGDESIRVRTHSPEWLLDQVLAGELRDGRTALGLLRYVADRTELSVPNPE
jgi:ADP-ribose pyrophosphatase